MKKDSIFLILLILGIFILNYSFLDNLLISAFLDYEYGIVSRVIDGDTIVINGSSVRLLGINSPERGEVGYNEAKEFLNDKILGEEVRLEFGNEKLDKYKRKLAYIFLDNKNINLESVKNGLSSFYFPKGKTKYYKDFTQSWEECLEKNINLCEKSGETCIKLEYWYEKNQRVVLKNICPKTINLSDWSIKDEGRKKFVFNNKSINPFGEITITNENFNEDYVWTKTGDSIFIRDNVNRLVIFETY